MSNPKPSRRRAPVTGATSNAPQLAAAKLRQMVLEREEGAFLGSRDELSKVLGVGRVTLHQAARILEHDNLLTIRRGKSGGYFAARPNEERVERVVAIYLRANRSGFSDALRIAAALGVELMRRAALSRDAAALAALRAVAERIADPRVIEDDIFLRGVEHDFWEAIFPLAANPMAELMLRVVERMYYERPQAIYGPGGRHWWQRGRAAIAQAVLDGDEILAQMLARRFVDDVLEVLEAVEAGQAP